MFECVESKISFEAPRLRQKMAMQLLVKVEAEWVGKRMGVLIKCGRTKNTRFQV